jgi:hypothetical protein
VRGVDELVTTVSVDVPPPVTFPGENTHDDPEGHPVTLNATVSLKPPEGVTVTPYVVDLPRLTVRLAGDAATVKSGTGIGLTVSVTIVDCTSALGASVAAIVNG